MHILKIHDLEIFNLIAKHAHFIFANAQKNKDAFNDRLDFEKFLILYEGNDDWVESAILDIHECLSKDTLPEASQECGFCKY